MHIFKLIEKLPAWLDVEYRGRIYKNMELALIVRGSRLWLSYIGHGFELCFYERIDNYAELKRFVHLLSSELRDVKVYKAKKLFNTRVH